MLLYPGNIAARYSATSTTIRHGKVHTTKAALTIYTGKLIKNSCMLGIKIALCRTKTVDGARMSGAQPQCLEHAQTT